jgi:hypothetical protein
MFKKIVIEMTGPICGCRESDLSWSPQGPLKGLVIKCRTCETVLEVAHAKFLGSFKFDTPYPDGEKVANEEARREELDKARPVGVSVLVDPTAVEG